MTNKHKNFFLLTVFSFILILSLFNNFFSTNVCANTPRRTVQIFCTVNISYIEDFICQDDNCSPYIKKWYEGGMYTVDDFVFTVFNSSNYTFIELQSPESCYQRLTTNITLFFQKVCTPDITPVLNYLNNTLISDYMCYFYPQTVESSDEKVTQISDKWYMLSSSPSFSFSNTFLESPYAVVFILVIFIVIITMLISIWKYNKEKKRKYLIIYICMTIVIIILVIVFCLLYYACQMI
jgi:hypothetical protein